MAQFEHRFTVQREIDGEVIECQLIAEFEISEDSGVAHLCESIDIIDEDGKRKPWDSILSDEEEDIVTNDAFQTWSEGETDPDGEADFYSNYEDDRDFHDERAVRLSNGGKVYW